VKINRELYNQQVQELILIYFFLKRIFHIHSLKKDKSIKLLHYRVKAMRLQHHKNKNLTIKSYLWLQHSLTHVQISVVEQIC
jgi:hypothetical protein